MCNSNKFKKVDGREGQEWLAQLPALVILIAVGVIAFYKGTFPSTPAEPTHAAWGAFGDYFGGLLNPIISACTLIVAVAVWKLQKTELNKTQQALEKQLETADKQRSEQRFFDLLDIYYRTVDSVTVISIDNRKSQGKEALSSFLHHGVMGGDQSLALYIQHGFTAFYRSPIMEKNAIGGITVLPQAEGQVSLAEIQKAWQKLGNLDHYFRTIYRLLAEAEKLLGEEHIRYVKLLRAQLSGDELCLLGFNVWLNEEGKKMLPLARRYGLFKHLPNSPLRTHLEAEVDKIESHESKSIFGQTYEKLNCLKPVEDKKC
jgi:Putative phage abortive infection protein